MILKYKSHYKYGHHYPWGGRKVTETMISASGKRTLDCTGLMRASLGYAGIIFPSVYPGKGNFAKKAFSHGFKYIGKGS